MSKKEKILIITPSFIPLLGGMEEQCYLLGREFLRCGYGVDILTERTKLELPKFEAVDGLNVFRISNVRNRNVFGYISIASSLVKFVYRRRNEYKFCIIRTLTFHALIVGLLKFLHLVRFKTIATAETGGDEDDLMLLKKRKLSKLFVKILNHHDFLNSICNDNFKHYKNLGFDYNKLTRFYNGIDVSFFDKADYPLKISNFLFIGRLVKEKGLFELLEAFKKVSSKYPAVKLFIGGDGLGKDYVINFIKENKLEENIKYLGFISRDKKRSFFARGDCVVLPSYSEGFPISIIEATLYKRLIISTDISDLKSLYKKNIIFCKKRDCKDLYTKIIYTIENYSKSSLDYSHVIKKVDIRNLSSRLVDLME